jgi:hypothetical protein
VVRFAIELGLTWINTTFGGVVQKPIQQELLGHINRAVPVLADPPKRFRLSFSTEQAY